MILGPVTSTETALVAPIAQRAGVPVLAFTNDQTVSQPGVWTLGITPGQQVRRLVGMAREADWARSRRYCRTTTSARRWATNSTRIASARASRRPSSAWSAQARQRSPPP